MIVFHADLFEGPPGQSSTVDLFVYQDGQVVSHYRWTFSDPVAAFKHYEHLQAIKKPSYMIERFV